MKHFFGYASVFALAAGFSLSSCSSDDAVESAPDFSGNGEAVKTQFAISVPGGVKSSRMTQEETQTEQTPEFKGMKNINVLTFKRQGGVQTTAKQAGERPISGSFVLDNITAFETNSKAKVYDDVKIDLGVDRMVFYGESAYSTDVQGQLNPTFYYSNGGTVENIQFDLAQVDAGAKIFKADAQGTKILEVLNSLTAPATNWKNATDETNLKNLYNHFITLKNGSAVVVKGALSDLYTALSAIEARQETGHEVATSLIGILKKSFDVTGSELDGYTLAWKTESTVTNFPENVGLPVGVALMKFSGDKFSYDVTTSGGETGKKYTVINDIVKPSSLYYFANTDLAVSDDTKNLQSLVNGKAWSDVITAYGSNPGVISFTTRSVSLKEEVNYAVAQLKTSVRIKNGQILDKAGNTVGVTEFPVTGILIGGQKAVDWKFEQKSDATPFTIYDNKMPEGMVASKTSAYSAANPTLVLESLPAIQDLNQAAEDVYIAVEFENTGETFEGFDGTVKNGSKFYLVAQLKYDSVKAGEKGVNRIFQKDHFTEARLTIDKLSNAYITIPDLRASKLEFGLSVDLTWQAGLTFDQNFD